MASAFLHDGMVIHGEAEQIALMKCHGFAIVAYNCHYNGFNTNNGNNNGHDCCL